MMNYRGDAWTDVPEFGEQHVGGLYHPRPGAYAVLLDTPQRLAVLQTPTGCFLPGGGAASGETPEETLHREVLEECGYTITDLHRLGEAVEYVFAASEQQYFRKQGVFFLARPGRRLAHQPEPDHTLLWLSPDEALSCLSHHSHVWVVRRVLMEGNNSA